MVKGKSVGTAVRGLPFFLFNTLYKSQKKASAAPAAHAFFLRLSYPLFDNIDPSLSCRIRILSAYIAAKVLTNVLGKEIHIGDDLIL